MLAAAAVGKLDIPERGDDLHLAFMPRGGLRVGLAARERDDAPELRHLLRRAVAELMDETDVEADACAARKDTLHPVGPDVVGVADVRPAPHSAHVSKREPLAAQHLASVAREPHRIRGFAGREIASRPHVVFRLAAAVEVGEARPKLASLLALHP